MEEVKCQNCTDLKQFKLKLEEKIKTCDKVVIVPHNNIDFDAIGSAIALTTIANKYKKQFYIVVNDNVSTMDMGAKNVYLNAKDNYNIITKNEYLNVKDDNDLIIFTDVNKVDLVSVSDVLPINDNIVMIDHHYTDESTIESSIKYVNPNSSSASEIVTILLDLFRIKLSIEEANYLLAGIKLDTASFSKNASPLTHKIVAKLMEYGATNEKVDEWFVEEVNSDRRVHNLISLVELYTYKLAIVKAHKNDIYLREELAKAADYLLKYGVDASFVIGNIDGDVVSISARSKNKVNVGEVMELFNGGGNSYSGAAKIVHGDIEEIANKLLSEVEPRYYVKK